MEMASSRSSSLLSSGGSCQAAPSSYPHPQPLPRSASMSSGLRGALSTMVCSLRNALPNIMNNNNNNNANGGHSSSTSVVSGSRLARSASSGFSAAVSSASASGGVTRSTSGTELYNQCNVYIKRRPLNFTNIPYHTLGSPG